LGPGGLGGGGDLADTDGSGGSGGGGDGGDDTATEKMVCVVLPVRYREPEALRYTLAFAPAPVVDAKLQVDVQVVASTHPVGIDEARLFQIATGLLKNIVSPDAYSHRKPLLSTVMTTARYVVRLEVTVHVATPAALNTVNPICRPPEYAYSAK